MMKSVSATAADVIRFESARLRISGCNKQQVTNLVRHFGFFAMALWLSAGTSAWGSDTVTSRYDVRLIGLKVGEMVMASAETPTQYSTRARFRTTGAFATLSQASFDISAKGRRSGDRFVPAQYREITSEGRHNTNVKIAYRSGVATEISGDTGGRVPPVDPLKMRGALDPLTVVYAALRRQPASQACALDADVFDGQRHARLTLTTRQATADGITCHGRYHRIAGYSSPSKINTSVPISVRYTQDAQELVAQTITVRTRYGKVTLHRR